MDAIEQMMKRRASELEAIVGGLVAVHCELNKNRHDEWFSWFASVQCGDHSDLHVIKDSFSDVRKHFERKVTERAEMEKSAELYDVIYAGG